jgi:predicted DNA-binding protein
MEHPTNDANLRAEAARDRDDPTAWEDTQVEVKPAGTEVISFRVPSPLLDRIEEAAEASGRTLSQFLRDAIEAYLSGTVGFTPSAEVASSARQMRIYLGAYLATVSEGLPEHPVPDFPPVAVGGTISGTTGPSQKRKMVKD